jgi:hypothetical protein
MTNNITVICDLHNGDGSYNSSGGYLYFTPNEVLTDSSSHALLSAVPIGAHFTGGSDPSVSLAATDNTNILPSGWTWVATSSANLQGAPSSFSFYLPAGPASFTAPMSTPAQFAWTPTTELTTLPNGTGIQLTGGSLPGGFSVATTYYVVQAWGTAFGLSTIQGGPAIIATSSGSGTLTVVSMHMSALAKLAPPSPSLAYLPTLTANSTVTSSGALVANVLTEADATSGALTMTFPVTTINGTLVNVEKYDSSANSVTLSGSIRGQASSSYSLTNQYQAVTLIYFNGSWWPVASGGSTSGSSAVFAPTGLTGATTASRYVGATASGAPGSGTFVKGDFIVDQTGAFWVCTTAGSPGTWTEVVTPGAAADYAPTGLTGATSASRYVGATASGAPGSGTFVTGDFVIDQTGAFWICTTGGSPGTWTEVVTGKIPDIQWFTTPGTATWNKPTGAQVVQVVVCGGGGAGGSGAINTASTPSGGNGGAGGGVTQRVFTAADLTSMVTVTVGAGGTGAAAITGTSSTVGNPTGSSYPAGVGGSSSFGAYTIATGGGQGHGGGISSANGLATVIGVGTVPGGAGAFSTTSGAGLDSVIAGGPTGGGGGGYCNVGTTTAFNGGNGQYTAMGSSSNIGTAGTVAGPVLPGTGSSTPAKGTPGCGGGGGAGAYGAGVTAQTGATPYFGGGGGGGGAAGGSGTLTSGAGGSGGSGFVLVISYFQ